MTRWSHITCNRVMLQNLRILYWLLQLCIHLFHRILSAKCIIYRPGISPVWALTGKGKSCLMMHPSANCPAMIMSFGSMRIQYKLLEFWSIMKIKWSNNHMRPQRSFWLAGLLKLWWTQKVQYIWESLKYMYNISAGLELNILVRH